MPVIVSAITGTLQFHFNGARIMSQFNKSVNNQSILNPSSKAFMGKLLLVLSIIFTLAWLTLAFALAPSAMKADFDSADAAVNEQKLRNAGYYDDDLDFNIDPESFSAANEHANDFLRENRTQSNEQ